MNPEEPCHNGDTLADLNVKQTEVAAQLEAARDRLKEAEKILSPFRSECDRLENKRMNIACRINIWFHEKRQRSVSSEGYRYSNHEPPPTPHPPTPA